jgi:hypothetical protein
MIQVRQGAYRYYLAEDSEKMYSFTSQENELAEYSGHTEEAFNN